MTYHPAFDQHHAAFRLLRLIVAIAPQSVELDKLRILDFYLLFPHLLPEARLPQALKARARKLGEEANQYSLPAMPEAVFKQMAPIQAQGVRLLLSVGLSSVEQTDDTRVRRSEMPIPPEISEAISKRNSEQASLMTLLTKDVASIPLRGKNGLKDRSGLMEFKYDAI
nr:ABC-three component system middle component 5 [Corallococcus exiguus]